jgi:peptide/nickel transport system ATP-binding protein
MTQTSPLLEITDLRAHIATTRGVVRAVDGVSMSVGTGESLGVVGESGSGKSVLAKAIMGILPGRSARAGSIRFDGRELLDLDRKQARALWGREIAMVFQDPGRSLNPVVRIERQLTESMRKHLGVSSSEAHDRALRLLAEVGVSDPERRLRAYPHQLSGGMRQRVMIAVALSCEPRLLIADEPTTALDVTIQRQILDLLRRIQIERQMSMIFISHDLAVVAGNTDRVAVMYAGKVAELGRSGQVFSDARHRYTHALLGSTPTLDHHRHARLPVIPGSLPNPVDPPPGCRFAARCAHVTPSCTTGSIEWREIAEDHRVACLNPAGSTEVLVTEGVR